MSDHNRHAGFKGEIAMKTNRLFTIATALLLITLPPRLRAQPYGQPDRAAPGDSMIQGYLKELSEQLHERFLQDIRSLEDWKRQRTQYREEYLHMLGLWPLPPKTPLQATITRSLPGDGFQVDMIHYQSRPGLYVTGNLYRPARATAGERRPAIFYVCGHSPRGRNGNKTAYQSHGIWFARHGYVCLVVDTLQLGEIGALHHGTYREERWWWHSRGYTPAGVECWNGIRGIDYLISRPDVDPNRIGVTGISGGGAATFWIAAADERVQAAVPVSGMADLPSYVANRVINGHCDCMFLDNTFAWPWTRIAALIAPRPLLFVNSDQDPIFPMDANERIQNRLERVYSLYGAGDCFDSVVSIGGHAYRKDIRQAAFRFLNTHLKHDPRPIADSEIDLVSGEGQNRKHPIAPELLRVFPQDADLPSDQLNTSIDQHFVPKATVALPSPADFAEWKAQLLNELHRLSFRWFPPTIPAGRVLQGGSSETVLLETEPGIEIRLRQVGQPQEGNPQKRILLLITTSPEDETLPDWLGAVRQPSDLLYLCEPRGVGSSRWTRKNPPNYVERSHVLLGRTVAAGQIWDLIAAAGYCRTRHGEEVPIYTAGTDGDAILAAYAALWAETIQGTLLHRPSTSHMDPLCPAILNCLRVCDVPDLLGMVAPRSLTILDGASELTRRVSAIYTAAQAQEHLVLH